MGKKRKHSSPSFQFRRHNSAPSLLFCWKVPIFRRANPFTNSTRQSALLFYLHLYPAGAGVTAAGSLKHSARGILVTRKSVTNTIQITTLFCCISGMRYRQLTTIVGACLCAGTQLCITRPLQQQTQRNNQYAVLRAAMKCGWFANGENNGNYSKEMLDVFPLSEEKNAQS